MVSSPGLSHLLLSRLTTCGPGWCVCMTELSLLLLAARWWWWGCPATGGWLASSHRHPGLDWTVQQQTNNTTAARDGDFAKIKNKGGDGGGGHPEV